VQSLEKYAAARAAADEIRQGMVVGLGTGSTVAELIPILAARLRDGLAVRTVATSRATEAAARAAGIPVIAFEDRATVDLTIDGVDEIDPLLHAIKGAGGALLREKIVAAASHRMIAIADASKWSAAIGTRAVPIEILPFARDFVLATVAAMGAHVRLRVADGQWARSDQDNLLADCLFPDLSAPQALAARLSAIPGLLGHGLFLGEIDAVYIARGEAVTRYEREPAS
jgi:ribose 5-phosphate isomerase A